MFIVQNYSLAVVFCVLTMLCWGSWANARKLAPAEWRFELFYWDYALGVLLISFLFGITLGNAGHLGRPFFADLRQASASSLGHALFGGVVFNLANILLVAAIEVAGMAVAFPVGIGLALVLGVILNYIAVPVGNPRRHPEILRPARGVRSRAGPPAQAGRGEPTALSFFP